MTITSAIEAFLTSKRVAVADVSRSGNQPANAVFRKLRAPALKRFRSTRRRTG
jgi:hypothetical protein